VGVGGGGALKGESMGGKNKVGGGRSEHRGKGSENWGNMYYKSEGWQHQG